MAGKAVAPRNRLRSWTWPRWPGLVGLGGIIGGLLLEGGSLGEIISPTALMIVLGGTAGAVTVSTPFEVYAEASSLWQPCSSRRSRSLRA